MLAPPSPEMRGVTLRAACPSNQGRTSLISTPRKSALSGTARVRVDALDRTALAAALAAAGARVDPAEQPARGLVVAGLDAARTGEVARDAGIALTHLSDEGDGLESVFLALTADEEGIA